MMKAHSVRGAAYESLVSFAKHGKYTNLEVAAKLSKYDFSDADKRLYTTLVYGVAERIPTIDHIVSRLSSRPLDSIDIETLTCLRLGIYQLLYTDRIPDHAAVSETVSLANPRSKGFVNALLRTFLRSGKDVALPDPGTDMYGYLSVRYSCPKELCAFLCGKLGEDRCEKVLSSFLEGRRATVRVNTLKCAAEELTGNVFPRGTVNPLFDDMIDVDSLSGADMTDGRWFVQDAASRLAVSALSPLPGETVVDTCAAPGGKSFSASIDMKNEGKVFSFDLHENKTDLIRRGAARLGIDIIDAACRDATKPDPSLTGKADRVICDAPCSGLGVISKKPDIKYKSVEDISRLPDVQIKVLEGASEYVRRGGVIVYSTCTVNPDENEGVVSRFLDKNKDFTLVPFTAGGITSESGMLTLLPYEYGTDGFFISKMTRNDGN
ncbi:MAG: 16S rRNA (cytosine(967)-C(5))-methyltransferase RsmB [Clostridia bacterium]|nr:16S rRNA (cytosine(967)-C(5))-methyltransferase RsmB [Clostridia bacterium]